MKSYYILAAEYSADKSVISHFSDFEELIRVLVYINQFSFKKGLSALDTTSCSKCAIYRMSHLIHFKAKVIALKSH